MRKHKIAFAKQIALKYYVLLILIDVYIFKEKHEKTQFYL